MRLSQAEGSRLREIMVPFDRESLEATAIPTGPEPFLKHRLCWSSFSDGTATFGALHVKKTVHVELLPICVSRHFQSTSDNSG